MKRNYNQSSYINNSMNESYVYGNTVRKYNREQTTRERQKESEIRRKNLKIRRNKQAALEMDLPYLIMLTIASIAALFIIYNYLSVQSMFANNIKSIEAYEKKLEFLKNSNDELEIRINTSTDLDKIYEVATKELGMVYATKEQVIRYDKTESEYVRQYEDIPQ